MGKRKEDPQIAQMDTDDEGEADDDEDRVGDLRDHGDLDLILRMTTVGVLLSWIFEVCGFT